MEFRKAGSGALAQCTFLPGNMKYEYIYFYNTYEGLFISDIDSLIKSRDHFLNKSKIILFKFISKQDPYVIVEKDVDKYEGVLKSRCCMAGVESDPIGDDGDRSYLNIVWFDDGNITVEESLLNILKEVDWNNYAKDFSW